MAIPFALPDIGEEEIAEVVDTLKSGWLTTGPKTKRFEKDFSSKIGCKHAIAVNSATAGLHLALEAIGISPGDKVATTCFTFTATAEIIRYLGADPVFVDIDPLTLNMDVDALASVLATTPNIKAVIPVHFAGQTCDMDHVRALAKQYDIKIVEDAAHALPTTYNGANVGTLGDLTVYSFYVTKTLATGEGGMVVTNDSKLAKRIKIMRLHGISKDAFDRYTDTSKPSWYYEVVAPGYKYNLTDIASAIGIHQLQKVERFQQTRELIAQRYTKAFASLPLQTPHIARLDDMHAWHLYVIQLDLDRLTIDRNRFIELLSERHIGSSVHFIPLHLQPYWRDHYDFKPDDFPVASHAFERIVSLPIYSKMSDDEVEQVIEVVRDILQSHSK